MNVRRNIHAGTCRKCGHYVEKEEGRLFHGDGGFEIEHYTTTCPTYEDPEIDRLRRKTRKTARDQAELRARIDAEATRQADERAAHVRNLLAEGKTPEEILAALGSAV